MELSILDYHPTWTTWTTGMINHWNAHWNDNIFFMISEIGMIEIHPTCQ